MISDGLTKRQRTILYNRIIANGKLVQARYIKLYGKIALKKIQDAVRKIVNEQR